MSTEIQTILRLKVPLIVQVGQRELSLDDVLALGPGAILELQKLADASLDLMVNNKLIGKGLAVKVNENFGIRISEIGTARERVEALSSSSIDETANYSTAARADLGDRKPVP